MKDKKSSQKSKNCSVKKEQKKETTESRSAVCTDCEISSCNGCGIYRQMIPSDQISYTDLLKKTLSKENIQLFKMIGITAISLVASLINFSRIAGFKEEQLYLETILLTVLYYLTSCDPIGSILLLLGGLFGRCFAFRTRHKILTVFVTTCLQVKCRSLRQHDWVAMGLYVAIYCVAANYTEVIETHYVSSVLYSLFYAYCSYVSKIGLYLEDLFLFIIVFFAAYYHKTDDVQHCSLQYNLTSLIIWIMLKETRVAFQYTGLGFRIF